MTLSPKRRGASLHLFPKRVPIIGFDSTIIAKVAGIYKNAVYFAEDAKTVLSKVFSFSGFIFEKTGNMTVAIGIVKNVGNTVKFVAMV